MAVRDRLEPHTKTSEASGYPYWGWIIAILGLTLYAALAVTRLETWRALTNDMGWYSQALWTISHGHWTAPATLAGRSPIGQAESYALYPLAGIYRLAGQPGILVVQAAALASGVLPLTRLVQRRGVPAYLGVFLVVAYLCYPAVVGTDLFDFHPDVLVVPLFFWALQALEEKRWPLYLTMMGLAPLVKNELAAVTIVMAIPLVYRRYWGWAALTAGWATAILILDFHVVGPYFEHYIADWGQYGYLGSTPHQALTTVLTHPVLVWRQLTRARALEYLAVLLIPLLVWPVVTGVATGAVWPGLAVLGINILSNHSERIDPYGYFSVAAAPFLFWTAAQWLPKHVSPRVATATFALVTTLSVATGVVARKAFYWPANPPIVALDRAAKIIPATAPLYGSQTTLPLLVNRTLAFRATPIRVLVKPVPGAWLLLSTWDAPWQQPEGKLVRYALTHAPWTLRFHQGSVWLFEALP